MNKSLRNLVVYVGVILAGSIGYFVYAFTKYPPTPERETFLTEVGEGVGEVAMYALIFIYLRTVLKLLMGKGPISRRLLPDYKPPASASLLKKIVVYLDRTHVHVGIASVAIIAIHIALMGQPLQNLFFVAVIGLVAWQTVFGLFLRWRKAPQNMKRFSFSVHAQLVTGIMLGVFAWFGHMLVDA